MSYNPRTTPRAHQTEALHRITTRPRSPSNEDVFALLMDMGTGKSKVICDEWGAGVDEGKFDNLLIIAPAGSYRNWDLDRGPEEPSELTKHLDPGLRARTGVCAWVSGMGVGARRELDAFLEDATRPRVLVVNVEALSKVKDAIAATERFLNSGRTLMVVDESTVIKNPRSKRTKQVVRLGKLAVARRILTGLVAPRDPLDVYSQFEFLDWRILDYRNYYSFRARYAITKKMLVAGRNIDIVVAYQNIEELHAKINRYSYRVLKEECLDLEPKIYLSRDVPLAEEQERMYKEMKRFATARLENEVYVTATSVITQLLRLHQLVCGFMVDDETGAIRDVPERRTEAMLETLEEHRGKAIIWVPYDYLIRRWADRLRKEYDEGSVACFWGGNRSTRAEDESRFKQDPACRWMLSTQGAGGRGNTWVGANLSIYGANNYDLEQRAQSEDRNHRHGQTESVTYMDLIARGTVDEKFIQVLRNKITLSSAITGENYRSWLV